MAKTLAKIYKNIENLANASLDDLLAINDVGPVCAQNVFNYFRKDKNKELIQNLKDLGLNMNYLKNDAFDTNNFFYNKKVVLTGTLSKYTRSEAGEILESLGSKVQNSVSKVTDLVIYGVEAGSKLDKAKKFNVQTLNEDEFISKLKECGIE